VVVDARANVDPLARWGVDRDRIRVVHPGVPDRPAGALPAGVPDRFVLFVGALEPRKDPELLVRAHAKARDRGLDADLVFAGSGRLAGKLRAPGVHVVQPTNGELGALYERAIALAMPSRLEGFGFPPLEAARAGTPSVVSDLPVFEETLGEGALRVPAGDVAAWTEALLRVEGRAVPEVTFSWRQAASELHSVFAEVAA
jgi:alpha-1,3-rhamnosyl/mannosyltransferase